MSQGQRKVRLHPVVGLSGHRIVLAGNRDTVTQAYAAEPEMIGVAALELRRRSPRLPVVTHRGREIEVAPPTGQGLVDIDQPLAARAPNGVRSRAGAGRL